MKTKLLTATLLATLALPLAVQANGLSCENVHTWGNNAMVSRQNGESMVEAMNKAENQVQREAIKLAYQRPRYNTMEYKRKAVSDFANELASVCYAQKR